MRRGPFSWAVQRRARAFSGGLQTATLMKTFDGSFARAGAVLAVIYLVGAFVVLWAPETKGRELT